MCVPKSATSGQVDNSNFGRTEPKLPKDLKNKFKFKQQFGVQNNAKLVQNYRTYFIKIAFVALRHNEFKTGIWSGLEKMKWKAEDRLKWTFSCFGKKIVN